MRKIKSEKEDRKHGKFALWRGGFAYFAGRGRQEEKGYVAILTVLMIAAVGIILASVMSLTGIDQAQSSVALTKGEGTLAFVEGCADNALLNVWASANYAGGNITTPQGTCTVAVSKNGNVWTITVGTTATDYARTIQVVGTRGATNFTVSSWKEI